MKDLLINFLFILLSLFLLQMTYYFSQTRQWKVPKKNLMVVFPALSILLCMAFPVEAVNVGGDFKMDLRRIPFILGVLYGGYGIGFFLFAMIIVVRSLTAGVGFYITLVALPLFSLPIFLLAKQFLKRSVKQRIILSTTMSVMAAVTFMLVSHFLFNIHLSSVIWLQFVLVDLLAMLVTVVLWEGIRKNFYLLQGLIKAEKLEVVSHLAASISHEVRNPLAASKGFIQLLREDTTKDERNMYLTVAEQELNRAEEIINDYLTFAKPSIEGSEPLNMTEEIQQALKVIKPLANMNAVQLKVSFINNGHCIVLGEQKKLQQCLVNILKNGIEAMPNGGELCLNCRSDNSYVEVTIQDTGQGMTKEQVARLGEPYFTTKEKGTGLGMMVSFSIIKGMNGKINVKSEKGIGTHFLLKVPICPPSLKEK